jgi:hypothetical protein
MDCLRLSGQDHIYTFAAESIDNPFHCQDGNHEGRNIADLSCKLEHNNCKGDSHSRDDGENGGSADYSKDARRNVGDYLADKGPKRVPASIIPEGTLQPKVMVVRTNLRVVP